jgi:phosphoribosylamine-glycine ligase
VAPDTEQALSILERNNAWFNDQGVGSVLFEEFAEGQEVCWGAWFNGEHFVSPLYSCIEHKGSQNGDRGGVLTGEVGTTMHYHYDLSMEPFLAGHCHGLVDMNTVLNPETGCLTFLEFTIRFGRPTLEVILAMAKPELSVAGGLCKLASGNSEAWPTGSFRSGYGVGVSVFPYGYPLLNWNDEAATGRTKTLAAGLRFEMPPTDGVHNTTEQFFCAWNDAGSCWESVYNERQFVVVGWDDDPEKAMQCAYEPLRKYHLFGHTWRDDVGRQLSDLSNRLVQHKVVPSA